MGVLPIYKISRYLEREGPSLCPDRNIKYRGIYLNIYTVSILQVHYNNMLKKTFDCIS